jgi:hypothetical protein
MFLAGYLKIGHGKKPELYGSTSKKASCQLTFLYVSRGFDPSPGTQLLGWG